MSDSLSVASVWRYPIKGLGGEEMPSASLLPKRGIAGDRRWLVTHKDASAMLAGQEPWRPWNYALTLKSRPQVALLQASLNDDDNTLTIHARSNGNTESLSENPQDDAGKKQLEQFLKDFLKEENLSLVDCEQRPAWDYDGVHMSVLFEESVKELSRKCGTYLDPRRFRANVVVAGGSAWDEREHAGKTLRLNENITLQITDDIERCPATTVNPDTAEVDVQVPKTLLKFYQHNHMGLKCAVKNGGNIASGDKAFW